MTVYDSTLTEFALFEKRRPGITDTALAAAVLRLAEKMDDPKTNSTAMANCANSLATLMKLIREGVPAEVEEDALDELMARRQHRRSK